MSLTSDDIVKIGEVVTKVIHSFRLKAGYIQNDVSILKKRRISKRYQYKVNP